jgi:Fungal Zn(2)-Cys(6) binuclear cluster domain
MVEASRSQSPDEAPASTRKRKRTAHACEGCRQRKSRCDGTRPKCTPCSEQGLNCHYRDAAPAPVNGSDPQRLARLEDRLMDMETMLRSMMPRQRESSALSPPPSSGSVAGVETSFQTVPGVGRITQALYGSELATGPEIIYSPQDSVDGMGSITFANETTSGFFGEYITFTHGSVN